MKKSDLYGIIGSAIFCGVILLLLLLIYMPRVEKPEDEGIIVSFGDSYEGGGNMPLASTQPPSEATPTPPLPTQPSTPPPSQEDLMTQEDNSLAVAQQKENEEKERKEREEKARKEREEKERREREERERREQQERERKEREERERKEREAAQRAENIMGSAFSGTGDNTQGSGMTSGANQQGNPVGRGDSGGNSWSLNGRTLSGRFITPTYNKNIEGIITVTIKVDNGGNVTSATIGTPTTISDIEVRNATLDAARKTKFSPGERDVFGTITYNFKLK